MQYNLNYQRYKNLVPSDAGYQNFNKLLYPHIKSIRRLA